MHQRLRGLRQGVFAQSCHGDRGDPPSAGAFIHSQVRIKVELGFYFIIILLFILIYIYFMPFHIYNRILPNIVFPFVLLFLFII